MSRHRVIAWFAALVAVAALPISIITAAAQGATPEPSAVTLSYPELRIEATDAVFNVPTEIPAGRYLITLDNIGTKGTGAILVSPPAGRTTDELLAAFAATVATPTAPPPAWLLQATFAGGPGFVEAGQRSQAVIDLAPGHYLVLPDEGPQAPQTLQVLPTTNATPTNAPQPTSDVTVTEQEYGYTGLPSRIAAGPLVWQVANAGKQPHQMLLSRVPDGTTAGELVAAYRTLYADFSGSATTPTAPGTLDASDLPSMGGLEAMSPGRTAWAILDLPPGTYAALCFVNDVQSGEWHVLMGMVAVFTVDSGLSTAAGTPAP